MKIDEIIALTKAGFTKEEIMKLAGVNEEPPAEPIKEEPPVEPVKEEVPAEPAKEEPPKVDAKEELNNYIHEVVNSTFKPFEDLYNNMAKLAGMPSIDNVQPSGIDDIVIKILKD